MLTFSVFFCFIAFRSESLVSLSVKSGKYYLFQKVMTLIFFFFFFFFLALVALMFNFRSG